MLPLLRIWVQFPSPRADSRSAATPVPGVQHPIRISAHRPAHMGKTPIHRKLKKDPLARDVTEREHACQEHARQEFQPQEQRPAPIYNKVKKKVGVGELGRSKAHMSVGDIGSALGCPAFRKPWV